MKSTLTFFSLPSAFLLFAFIQGCSSGGDGGSSSSGSGPGSSSSSSGSSSGSLSTYSKHDLVIDLADQIAIGYENFDVEAKALKSQADIFCADSENDTEFSTLQGNWQSTMLAWQYVQGVSFGPITEDFRNQRIFFYPVPNREDSQEKIDSFISGPDEITLAFIQGKSSTRQGLIALEYVLFRDDALTLINQKDTGGNKLKACQLITSIAENITTMTTPTAEAWNGDFYDTFTATTNLDSSLEDWFGGQAELFLLIEGSKLTTTSLSDIETPLAQTSILNIKENLRFFQTAFIMNESTGIDQALNDQGSSAITDTMLERLNTLQALLSTTDNSAVLLNTSEEGKVELQTISKAVRDAGEDLGIDVAETLNVFIGFNSVDGD